MVISLDFEVISLCKSYKKRKEKKSTILNSLSFATNRGSVISIAGSNGSGKSTLLSVLAGILKADSGSFLYCGDDLLNNKKKLSSLIGYVPQENVLMEELSGLDNLKLWYNSSALKSASEENGILSLLDVSSFVNKKVSQMSGGMKKRLSIACAVARSPKVLLLDEPSGALDLPCKQKLYDYYKSFAADGGIVVIATHEIEEIALSNKVFIFQDGTLFPYEYDGDASKFINLLSDGDK